MKSIAPVRSWLYAPGNNPKLLGRVFTAGADAVVLDLEDAVPPAEKDRARRLVAEAVGTTAGYTRVFTSVRVNHPSTGATAEDIDAVVQPGLRGLRIPKVEAPETILQIDEWLTRAEMRAGMAPGSVSLVCSLESAVGVWRALDIARCHSRVSNLGFGGVDFVRDVNATPTVEGHESFYARSHLVLASRVAGIRPPIDGVYARLRDPEGLERTTWQSRTLGFFGRSAIHPEQVPIINAIFTPSTQQMEWARGVVEAAAGAEDRGSGSFRLPGGDFVDVAVVRRAEDILRLGSHYAIPEE